MLTFIMEHSRQIAQLSLQHLQLSLLGVIVAGLLGIPLGIVLARYPRVSGSVMLIAEVIQTIPALAMLAILMMIFGLGDTTLILALVLYSLLPIVRNTLTGIRGVNPSLVEAATGMGMTNMQILFQVKLPLALPVILAGLRVALVTAIGIATIGVLIGAGGLGALIWRGIQIINNAMVLAGAFPAAILAILADIVLTLVERKVVLPRGLRKPKARRGLKKTLMGG